MQNSSNERVRDRQRSCKKSLCSFFVPDLSLCLSSLKPQSSFGCGFVQVSGTKHVIESKQNPLSKPQIFALII